MTDGPTSNEHDHDGYDHHGHDHGHGHHNDRGLGAFLRYVRWLPQLWRSEINDAVVALVSPRSGERTVDIGAGFGAGAFPAAATGAHVLAVEPTPFLRRAVQLRRLVSRHRRSIDIVDGAAEQIPAGDGTIDAVWAVNTMHHWVDVERGVAEIARVLGPGGRVVLVDEDFTDPTHPEHEKFGSDHGPEHHGFTMVEAASMADLLRSAGLIEVDTSLDTVVGRPVLAVTARKPN